MSRKPATRRSDGAITRSAGAGAKASEPVERAVSFEDNTYLATLFGEHDQNLALIEHRLGVHISARGNHVFILGREGACDATEATLKEIYRRIATGDPVTPGDIEGIIRINEGATGQKKKRMSMGPSKSKSEIGKPGEARIVTRRRTILPRSRTQQDYIKALGKTDLVFAIGPAGTGKTYLAVVNAVSLLEDGKVDRIILSRPAVEAGERLGFLPGDMREKIDPYVRPLYDALYDVMPVDRVEREIQAGIIEVAPLAFMRGRTLSNAVVILDEAQNCTTQQMRMFLTRLGEGSRMVVTGDPSQTDLQSGDQPGLNEAVELLRGIDGVEQITFSDQDVVRHDLVSRIVRAYDSQDQSRRNPARQKK